MRLLELAEVLDVAGELAEVLEVAGELAEVLDVAGDVLAVKVVKEANEAIAAAS